MIFRRKPRVHKVLEVFEVSGRIWWRMPAADFDDLFKDADVFLVNGLVIGNLGSGDDCIVVVREENK
jgi:hypothetical protein